jgi:hypothetical protein
MRARDRDPGMPGANLLQLKANLTALNAFSVAALFRISLTPRFSEVYVQAHGQNRFSGLPAERQETAEAVEARAAVVNTPLKKGVNQRIQSTLNRYSALSRQVSRRAP